MWDVYCHYTKQLYSVSHAFKGKCREMHPLFHHIEMHTAACESMLFQCPDTSRFRPVSDSLVKANINRLGELDLKSRAFNRMVITVPPWLRARQRS